MSNHHNKKIGLMGPFGYGNLGDAAIQDAMLQHIRKYFPDAEIYGFSLNPEDTQARHGIKSFPITRMSWLEEEKSGNSFFERLGNWLGGRNSPVLKKLEKWVRRGPREFGMILSAYRILKGFDVLIVSGGGQLDDYWGGGGPWSHPYTMLKWGGLARLRKAKFMFVSVGAGPLDAKLSQIFVRFALSLANYRSYRDAYSKEYVARVVGFEKNDPVYPDLAFSLQADDSLSVPLPTNPSRRIVGIGPIGYFKPGSWPEEDPDTYAAYLEKLASLVCWLFERQYAVLFLPGEAYYDQLAINDLIEILKRRHGGDLHDLFVEATIHTVPDLLTQIQRTEFVVLSRLHNIILSQSLNKPVIALSYQAKIDSLMANTGQANYCFPIQSFREQELMKAFEDLEANQATIRNQLDLHIRQYQASLDEQYQNIFGKLNRT
jgi:polysaccharide pyruvyl transferase WcaK-like protein